MSIYVDPHSGVCYKCGHKEEQHGHKRCDGIRDDNTSCWCSFLSFEEETTLEYIERLVNELEEDSKTDQKMLLVLKLMIYKMKNDATPAW